MEFLAKGKRGRVYLDGRYVVKKAAAYQIQNEVYWLKKLNKHKIGPRLIDSGEDWFKAGYIQGELIEDYFKRVNSKKVVKVLKDCLLQCKIMDKLRVNKKEMHHPVKHIIIARGKPLMIDFERCKITENPKNVTQFCQYILKLSGMFPEKIKIDKEKVIKAIKDYKLNQNEKNFKRMFGLLK